MKKRFLSFLTLALIFLTITSPSYAVWDKTKPAGNTKLNLVDDAIRANNADIETAIGQDHDFTTGSTQTGKHKQVTFVAPLASKPTVTGDEAALYTKSVSGKSQLFFEDEDAVESIISIPAGIIVPFVPGYFTDGSNAGFTYQWVSANTIAAVNTLLNPKGWYVCDGSTLNLAASVYFNGAGRYLPNLTDDRFLMGDTLSGGIGGYNSLTLLTANLPAHNHAVTIDSGGAHTHEYACSNGGSGSYYPALAQASSTSNGTTLSGGGHIHTASSANTGSGTAIENRPSYLSCFYIMKVM